MVRDGRLRFVVVHGSKCLEEIIIKRPSANLGPVSPTLIGLKSAGLRQS